MATDPYMGFTYPEIGGSKDAWGSLVSAALTAIGRHRHVPGEGVKVPVAGLLIDDDILALDGSGSYFALLQARALGLQPVAASTVAGDLNVFYVDSGASNNLYFKTQAGNLVRIINGAGLDISLLGGIVGDYASSGAEAAYVEADDAYTWKQPGVAPKAYAYMKCGPVDLHEPVAGVNQRVRLQSPAGLVASYAVTWPGALPAGTATLRCSSAGQLSFVNVDPRELNIHISKFRGDSAAIGDPFSTLGYITNFFGAGTVCAPLEIEVGRQILSYTQFYDVNGTGASLTPKIRRMNLATGTITNVAVGSADNTGTGLESQTVSSINHTVLTGEAYFIEVTVTAAGHRVHGATITIDG